MNFTKDIFLVFLFFNCLHCTAARAFALFNHFPSLRSVFPRVEILKHPTPLRHLVNFDVWIKQDDIVGTEPGPLGGNKARKLEFLLAEAKMRGAKEIVTVGMWGSNHALATAEGGRRLGFHVKLLLGPQPITDDVRLKLLSFLALGAEMEYYGSVLTLALGIIQEKLHAVFSSTRVFIPPGGSTQLGSIGYVNAFFELLDQVGGVGNLPNQIILPVGTGGTAAGLLAGSCLANAWEKTKIIGVDVSGSPLTRESGVRQLARQTFELIRSHLPQDEQNRHPICDFSSPRAFRFIDHYVAPGYGATSEKVRQTMALIKDLEGIKLDGTYSGKAMQFLIDDLQTRIKNAEPIPRTLFWLTYNSYDLNKLINAVKWEHPHEKWKDLSKKFQWIYTYNATH